MQSFDDPRLILEQAIGELDAFTKSESSRIEVEDGHLVVAKGSRLERVIDLARCYIGPIFSDQIRKEQQKRQQELKRAILRARDNIQRHSGLIERYKGGDCAQRKLAEMAERAIARYNRVISEDIPSAVRSDSYSYDRSRLLLDQEIKGQPIELPVTYIKNYDSHSGEPLLAHKTLLGLSSTLDAGAKNSHFAQASTTHKKNEQFLVDTFHIKAIGLIKKHLTRHVSEIVSLVKQGKPEVVERSGDRKVTMQQLIKVDAGEWIMVTGSFQRNTSHPEVMTMPMPMMDTFRICSQKVHTGFPYPSQCSGWALVDQWVEAAPLRPEQVPLFHQFNQRRKRIAHLLLTDECFSEKVRSYFKMKQEVFDKNRDLFLPLHRRLHQALAREMGLEQNSHFADPFYEEAKEASSSIDFLSHAQLELLHYFIREPMSLLEEEWLDAEPTSLRKGLPQERLQAASAALIRHRKAAELEISLKNPHGPYFAQQGTLLGKAFQSVGLQYQSEKMGFAPPLLNSFERRLQVCAFRQLSTFLDECESGKKTVDSGVIKEKLLDTWIQDVALIEGECEEEGDPYFAIANELEFYFNTRFYQEVV